MDGVTCWSKCDMYWSGSTTIIMGNYLPPNQLHAKFSMYVPLLHPKVSDGAIGLSGCDPKWSLDLIYRMHHPSSYYYIYVSYSGLSSMQMYTTMCSFSSGWKLSWNRDSTWIVHVSDFCDWDSVWNWEGFCKLEPLWSG